MKRRIAAAILLVLLVGWVAIPVLRAYQLVAALPSEPHPPVDLAMESFVFRAGPDVAADERTPDLAGWNLEAKDGAPAVVLVHGFKGSRDDMVPWARFLHQAGYNVTLFDMRGCGTSGGATIGLGATEPRDVSAAVGVARGRFNTTHIAVLGISLGAGAAILAAAQDPRISAVVADSSWVDQSFLLGRLSYLPVGSLQIPLPPLGVPTVNALVGTDVTKARPIDVIPRIAPRPVFLIHSVDDANATTPVSAAERLYSAAGEPKTLWIAPRGGHVGAINAFPEEYRARVLDFLSGAIG